MVGVESAEAYADERGINPIVSAATTHLEIVRRRERCLSTKDLPKPDVDL